MAMLGRGSRVALQHGHRLPGLQQLTSLKNDSHTLVIPRTVALEGVERGSINEERWEGHLLPVDKESPLH